MMWIAAGCILHGVLDWLVGVWKGQEEFKH